MKYLMSDGDYRSPKELCDGDLVGELERFIFCRAGTKPDQDAAMDILHELEKRLAQDNLDTKALEIAAEILAGELAQCPQGVYNDWPCPDIGLICRTPFKVCWLLCLRQKAGEEK